MTQIDASVLEILSTGAVEGNVFKLTCGQLDRKQYEAVNKVLDILGGKWNRRAGGHVFELTDAAEAIDQAILTGEVGGKNPLEFFETPLGLARQMVDLAEMDDSMAILEPSAGNGAIIDAIPEAMWGMVTAVELDARRWAYLENRYPCACINADFLAWEPSRPFDCILMNPPFSKGQDVAHVARACSLLAPGGRLVAIMSSGITFRQERRYQEFRALLDKRASWIIPNPEGSFKQSGTGVNTVTVVIDGVAL